MNRSNKVFIATSLDGYIADKNGGIDWLHAIPNPDNLDFGYNKFMSQIDALVMGRTTFETVCGFDMEWPYKKKVFVLSNSLQEVPPAYQEKVELVSGDLNDVLHKIHQQGFNHLYIDGGRTIQSFLQKDLIDELIISIIPCILGGGVSLFGELPAPLMFKCVETQLFLGQIVQNRFVKN